MFHYSSAPKKSIHPFGDGRIGGDPFVGICGDEDMHHLFCVLSNQPNLENIVNDDVVAHGS